MCVSDISPAFLFELDPIFYLLLEGKANLQHYPSHRHTMHRHHDFYLEHPPKVMTMASLSLLR